MIKVVNMVSGGFDNTDYNSNAPSEAGELMKSAGRKTGKAIGKAAAKVGKKGLNAVGNMIKKLFSITPKKIIIIVLIFMCCFIGLLTLAYFAEDLGAGEGKNYIDYNNTTKNSSSSSDKAGTVEIDELSSANAACLAYYETLSKQKSVYQVYTDENGNTSLILASDDNAKTDYFKNDDQYYVDPNLLYCMNKYIFGDNYVLPELFLNPVAYDEDYNLVSLTDDTGTIQVESVMRDETGAEENKTFNSVADYGVASVLSYKTETMTEELKGTYIMEDYYDEESGEVKQRDIEESFSFILSSEDYDVLDHVVCISGSVTYNYSDTSVKTENFDSDSSSTSDTDNVYKVLYDTKTIVTGYYAVNNYGDIKTFNTEEEMQEYLDTDPGYVGRIETESYDLYKYRSSDSGIYKNFVDMQSVDTVDNGNEYLYDYLTHFETYKPVMTRTYDTLATITSRASSEIYQNVAKYGTSDSSSGTTTGSGSTKFEKLYNGSARETIETIWDGLLQWGYSEEQAAAVLGNMAAEASFNTGSVNSIGAAGICQWYLGRRTTLENFAKSKGTEWADLVTQIQFACMELDLNNSYSYADCQWQKEDRNGESLIEYIEAWQNGNDVAEMAKAMAISWERPWTLSQLRRDSKKQNDCKARQNSAVAAYNLLHGKTFGHTIEVIDPSSTGEDGVSSSSTSAATYSMSDKDKETFSKFYSKLDLTTVYDGTYTINKYSKYLSTDEVDEMITLANAYINGVSYDDESLQMAGAMWSSSFISDLEYDNESGETFASTLDGVSISDVTDVAGLDLLFPVDLSGYTKFSSAFKHRKSPTSGASTDHKGIDIACAENTPIYAAADGVVEVAGYSNSAGNWIIINHGKNANGETIKTIYMHNNSLLVSVGDTVTRGQQIAKAGSTGRSTGNHCHFGLTINGVYYNPVKAFDMSNVTAKKNGEVTTTSFTLSSDFYLNLYYTDSTGFVQ